MEPPSRTWPDGRPVGGTNGYPYEFVAWNHECQARFVARRLRALPDRYQRRAEFDHWKKVMPGLDAERVKTLWAEQRSA